MAKTRSLEARLARLRLLREEPLTPKMVQELRAALFDASHLVVAEAVAILQEKRAMELVSDLPVVFERFLENPEQTDKQCRAKIAIADALNQLEYDREEFFWQGARYVQWEPVWGGQVDTAAPLRVACAFALVRLHAQGVMPYLVDLLADSEKPARAGAVQALAYAGTEAAALLLRLKARLGDAEPEVIAECFNSLIKLSPAEGVPFVAEFLDSSDQAIQEAALLALGDSRRREAFEILKTFWEAQARERNRETVLMALALLRLPTAFDFLLELVRTAKPEVAEAALTALALHRYDARLGERTAAAVAERKHPALQAVFDKSFLKGGARS
jgi:HEAT repeat protein